MSPKASTSAKPTGQKLYSDIEGIILERSEDVVIKKLSTIRNNLQGIGCSVDLSVLAVLLPRLVLLIEKYADLNDLVQLIISVLRQICSYEQGGDVCSAALATPESLSPLLSLYSRQRVINKDLYGLLCRIAPHDKLFAVKARFSGVLSIPLNDLIICQQQAAHKDCLSSVLQLLRWVLANRLNVTLLNRRGLLTSLMGLLKKKHNMSTVDLEMALVCECLATASRSKNSVMQLLEQGILELIVPLLERSGGCYSTERLRCLYAVLQILLHVVSFKLGRKAIVKKSLCQTLINLSDSLTPYQHLVNGISEILYRCLPPLKLPVERTSRTYSQYLRESLNISKRMPSPPNKPSAGDASNVNNSSFPRNASTDPKLDCHDAALFDLFNRITGFDENLEDLPYLGNIDKKQVLHNLAKDVNRPPLEVPSDRESGAHSSASNSSSSGAPSVSFVAQSEQWILQNNTTQNLEPLNVSPSLDAVALLNHVKAHFSGELCNKRYPIIYDVVQGPLYEDLAFESRFEGGNLRRVIQRSPREYDLILNPDVNTNRHHFWYYFAVRNLTPRVVYTFNLINLDRRDTMYTKRGVAGGLSPILFSDGSWTRLSSLPGFSLSCYKNHYRHPMKGHHYHTLSLTFLLPHNSTCYISSSFPYSYSLLRTHLCTSPFNSNTVFYKCRKMCNTVLGNKCYLLTITDKANLARSPMKPVVFISSRVHPGETNSSHIMNGAFQHLLSDHPTAVSLREKFVFYVVPMLNPDGVICGNQRCGAVGVDLNRQYETPDPNQHPTIFYTKALLTYLTAMNRTPFLLIDIHGHSRANNVFMFGCDDTPAQRLLPVLLHNSLKSFNRAQCTFKTELSKKGALRISAWKELNLPLSYTMECTIAGCDQRNYKGFHLGVEQLEEIGRELIMTIDKIGTNMHMVEQIAAKIDTSCSNQTNSLESADKENGMSESSSSEDEQNIIEEDD